MANCESYGSCVRHPFLRGGWLAAAAHSTTPEPTAASCCDSSGIAHNPARPASRGVDAQSQIPTGEKGE